MAATFFRLLEAEDKGTALVLECVCARENAESQQRFEVGALSFKQVPMSPFAYWVGDNLRKAFSTHTALEKGGRIGRVGLATHDDFRWLRLSWEVGPTLPRAHPNVTIRPLAKGGEYSQYFSDLHLAVLWGPQGDWLKTSKQERLRLGELTANNSKCWNEEHYFRPGLTWSRRTQGGLSLRAIPAGCIFGDKGPAVFVPCDDAAQLMALAAIMNSSSFLALVEAQMAFGSYEVGVIRRTPVPELTGEQSKKLAGLARRIWGLRFERETAFETAHAFRLPAVLMTEGDSVADRTILWIEGLKSAVEESRSLQACIDDLCFQLYGINRGDVQSVDVQVGVAVSGLGASPIWDGDNKANPEETDAEPYVIDLLSWCVGVAIGRFDIRMATGDRPIPVDPEPFEPLPVCSPGMLQRGNSLPLQKAPAGYPVLIDEDGILIDEPGHEDDIVARVREVLGLVFEDGDAIEREACEILGVKRLRDYFASTGNRGLWIEHVKRYSKSRRKAPIYWLIESPCGHVRFWLYLHRLDKDTLPKLLGSRYLGGMIERAKHDITELRAGGLTKAKEKNLAAVEERLANMEELAARIRRVLERTDDRGAIVGWDPDLDDGVVLIAAPLYELIPWPHAVTYKGRRMSELEKYWHELEDGQYDWAHIAMNYWPTRVEEVCRKDKSIAIAHDRLGSYESDPL